MRKRGAGNCVFKDCYFTDFVWELLQYGLEYGPGDVKFQIVLKMFPDSDDVLTAALGLKRSSLLIVMKQ